MESKILTLYIMFSWHIWIPTLEGPFDHWKYRYKLAYKLFLKNEFKINEQILSLEINNFFDQNIYQIQKWHFPFHQIFSSSNIW